MWLIAADSGESFPLYKEKLEAHAFAWSADGSQIFFSCESPLSKSAEEARKAQWKDVIRWREQERGDLLLAMPVSGCSRTEEPAAHPHLLTMRFAAAALCPGRSPPAPMRSRRLLPTQRATQIAWVTDSVSHRFEDPGHNEIYLVSSSGGEARRLTNNQAIENSLALEP